MELELIYINDEWDECSKIFESHEEMGIWIESNISEILIKDVIRSEE